MDSLFVGLGQRIGLREAAPEKLIDMIEKMKTEVFNPPGDPFELPAGLEFDPKYKWLIGLDWQFMGFLRLAALFEDAKRYGLFVGLDGVKAGKLSGINLEATYEKQGNAPGCFKGRLLVPSDLRRIDVAAATVTVPEIAFDLYRNGDFKVDVGFPYDLNFSRSLQIEVPPYKGAGGFYFSRLSRETSADSRVPKCDAGKGSFNQITELGLGISFGVGKRIDAAGFIHGELSLTADGLLEGTMGVYHPENEGDPGEGERFNWLKGVLGITGRAYGKADMGGVAAVFDGKVYARADVELESHKETNVSAEVGITATGEMEVDLGYGIKGSISQSFDLSFKADFAIGKNTEDQAPWKNCLPAANRITDVCDAHGDLRWHPIWPANRVKLELKFVPHVSLEQKHFDHRRMKYTAMCYIDSQDRAHPDGPSSFGRLAEGVLLWTLNAFLNENRPGGTRVEDLLNQSICADQLKIINDRLASTIKDGKIIVPYRKDGTEEDIVTFLKSYFEIELCAPPKSEDCTPTGDVPKPVAFFPMAPDFKLQVHRYESGSTVAHLVHEFNYDECTPAYVGYLQAIKRHINRYEPRVRTPAELAHDGDVGWAIAVPDIDCLSPTTVWFQDFIAIIAGAMIWESMDAAGGQTLQIAELVSATRALAPFRIIRTAALASRCTMFGMRVPDSPDGHTDKPVYDQLGQQFELPLLTSIDRLMWKLEYVRTDGFQAFLQSCPPESDDDPLGRSMIFETPACEIDRIRRLAAVSIPDDEIEAAGALLPYRLNPLTYSAKSPVIWKESNGLGHRLFVFPRALRGGLAPAKGNPTLQLMQAKERENGEPVPTVEYQMISLIEVSIRRQAMPPSTPVMAAGRSVYDIYQVDERGQELLEALVEELPARVQDIDTIAVLIHTPNGTWLSESGADVHILHSNMSTTNKPSPLRSSSPIEKLGTRLLRCALTNSEGFYLSYCFNGRGLPGDAFDDANATTGKVSILILYKHNALFSACMNGVAMTDAGEAPTLFFEDTTRYAKVPAFPPGHVGLEVRRADPARSAIDSDTFYLTKQFNLVGFKLNGNAAFSEQPDAGLPICSTPSLTGPSGKAHALSDTRYYEKMIPVTKFAISANRNANDRLLPENCSEPGDIYSGLGGDANVTVALRDAFGNILHSPTRTFDLPIRYRDFVVPVLQWPGTVCTYALTDSGILTVNLAFQPAVWPLSSIAQDVYKLAHTQLSQPDVEVHIRTSLTHATKGDPISWKIDKSKLIDYIVAVRCCPNDARLSCPATFETSSPIQPGKWKPFTELTIDLSIERTNWIDPAFQDVDAARKGVTRIGHEAFQVHVENGGTAASWQTLPELAQLLRQFYGVRLAIRSSAEKKGPRSLWIINYGDLSHENQLNVNIEPEASYFAVPPLMNCKLLHALEVETYAEDGEGRPVECKNVSEQEVDIQQWAKACLAQIDDMLSSSYIGVLNKVNGGDYLDQLLQIKSDLAQKISDSLDHVGEYDDDSGQSYSLVDAREYMRQQLLLRLSNAYEVDTIIQHPVNITSPYPGDEWLNTPRLYGSIAADQPEAEAWNGMTDADAESPKDVSFTAAKLSLTNGRSWLTYGASTKRDNRFKNRKFNNWAYTVTHLEHEIREVANTGGYSTSSWLTFVEPISDLKPGTQVSIPIPLREYPTPAPSLTAHRSVHDANANQLADARRWDYECTYRVTETVERQDRIRAVVHWNEGEANWRAASPDDFAKALAQLRYVYPAIKAHLDKLLSGTPCPDEDKVKYPIERFMTYVNLLHTSWPAPGSSFTFQSAVSESYIFDEAPQTEGDNQSPLIVTANRDDGSVGSLTSIRINGYETEQISPTAFRFYEKNNTSTYLSYENRRDPSNAERVAVFGSMDILDRHRAWAGIYLTRNENLFGPGDRYARTNAKFIYQTPLIRFASPIRPLLESNHLFDVSTLATVRIPKRLEDHMSILLSQVLGNRRSFAIKGSISYGYDLFRGSTTERLGVKVPHLLTLPFESADESAAMAELCGKMHALLVRKDGPLDGQGRFLIRLGIYESKDSEQPLLALNRLFLPVDQIVI